MDLRLVVRRGLTLTAAIVLSLLPVGLLLAFFWPRLLSHLRPDELAFLLAAIVAVALLIPLTRDAAARFLDRYVYRAQASFQRTVREASRTLTHELNLRALLRFLGRTVATATETEGVAIFVGDDAALGRATAEIRHSASRFTAPDVVPPAILAALVRSRQLLLTDEIASEPATDATRATLEELTRLDWALVLPLLSEDAVIGAVAVGPKLSGDPFYPQDLDLLMTLANQAGVAVRNAQLYAQVVLANEYIQNIVATIESGVVAVNAAGQVTMFNRSAEHLSGVPASQAVAQHARALPAALAEALTATLAEGQGRNLPEIALTSSTLPSSAFASGDKPPSGETTRPVICTTSPLRDTAGAVVGAVAVFSDLTPLKELERERRRAERLAYFELLASGIAHEIKNPLVAIKTFAQLLPRRHADEQFVENFSRVVTREIDRLEQILQRLRALSRPAERPAHAVDLRVPVREALEFLQPAFEDKSLRVAVALGDEACPVLGDQGELEELFLNLFTNATEAMPPAGTLSVDLTRAAGRVTVAVADTGPGIPPELLESVFDPFVTTKPRGSGLGLAIAAGIAQRHRAKLGAANRPSGGTVFTVDFPAEASLPAIVPA